MTALGNPGRADVGYMTSCGNRMEGRNKRKLPAVLLWSRERRPCATRAEKVLTGWCSQGLRGRLVHAGVTFPAGSALGSEGFGESEFGH